MRISDWSSDVCSSDLGADARVHVHRHVKNTNDQQLVLTHRLVIDHMRPVRELPVAFPDLVAGPSHQGVLRQRTKDLIHFLQVHIALPQPPPALREPRNRPQAGLPRPGQVQVPPCFSESNSSTSDSSLYLSIPLPSTSNHA